MLAHPPEKRAPVIYKIKKNFQTQKNNKKNIKKNYTFFLILSISPKNFVPLDKLNFSEDDRVRDLDRFPLNNFKFFRLSFQSSLHLSLTVLVRYRTFTHI